MVFLCQMTCEPKRNAQVENSRIFPHLRSCQLRQPRDTNKLQGEVLNQSLLGQHEAG